MPKERTAVAETTHMAKAVGEHYLAWIEANGLKQTSENFQAFVAGWTIGDSHHARTNTK